MADANRQRIESALRAAHAAGDTVAAQRLAQELRGASVAPAPMASTPAPVAPMAPPTTTFQANEAGTGQQIRLAAGYLLNASPEARKDMLREILGDEAQFETDANGRDIVSFRGERGYLNRPGFDIHDAIQVTGDMVKFAPAAKFASWAGRGVGGVKSVLSGMLGAGATQAASDVASGAFGSEQGIDPLGVAVTSAAGGAGELIAGRFRGWTPAARRAMDRAHDAGLELNSSPGDQVDQIAGAAGRMASPEQGAGFPAVAAGVRTAREAERRVAGGRFDALENVRATVPQQGIQELQSRVSNALRQFDLGADGMSALRRRTDELDQLADPSVPWNRKLQAAEQWRSRVRAMTPKDGSPMQAASERALREYDSWLDDAFNRNMIDGDPNAVNMWKEARSGWASFKERFDANRVIRDLASKDTTPEQMSKWLFNANAIGAKAESGEVVRRLNNILGRESAAMDGLRSEVILDISEPLLKDIPDVTGFVNNYTSWLARNPTLKAELFPGKTGKEFEDLMRFAKGVQRRPGASVADLKPQDIGGRVITLLNRMVLGHGIARGGAKIQAGGAVMNWLRRNTSGTAARRNLLREYLGEDPLRPLIPMPTAIGASAAGGDR